MYTVVIIYNRLGINLDGYQLCSLSVEQGKNEKPSVLVGALEIGFGCCFPKFIVEHRKAKSIYFQYAII